ncbi:IclR family transcriptional regulator [Mobilicoccus massiliensis]|uniref:IclR family transcriptional regulator n=1 Tax=Mobilicoccus massiliensis TaxID=1522310 RepID=UPI00058C03A4|nr:helix-turn-helix domain-containing protein [Mobilicoccus massiliensis]
MPAKPARSQTLDRGLTILELLVEAGRPMTVARIADASGLHRSIVYRLLRTLEDHRLVVRDEHDAYHPGLALAELSRGLTRDLAQIATAPLQRLADATDLAAFVVVREGGEAVVMLVVEPTAPGFMFTQRIGVRHDVRLGAPGHALRALQLPAADDDSDVVETRERGWAFSTGQVLEGVSSIAAPLRGYRLDAAVAVTFVGERDTEALAATLVRTAKDIHDKLR